jgi:thiamine-monophosphate kinase
MRTSETALLRRLNASAGSRRGNSGQLRLGIGDDAALFLPRRGYHTILTCDWFLEGTHFLRGKHPPESVGWKCLARAVSDVAAMGGEPRCFLLSLALPERATGKWLDQFLAGLRRAQRSLRCPLAGGDTTRRREILISVTVVGEVPARHAALRSGARPGDILFVSGRLGEAARGLQLLLRGKRTQRRPDLRALRKHLYPQPRLALAQWLSRQGMATAMMDLSDGLSSDLPRLCSASRVGATVEAAKIPAVQIDDLNRAGAKRAALALALNGGDDYELLFTVRPASARRMPPSFQGVRLTRIGEITRKRTLRLIGLDGREQALLPAGWDPFRS